MTTAIEFVFRYNESSVRNIDYGGIYFIYNENKLLYIGQSNNVGYRLTSYIRKQSHLIFKDATHVKIIRVDDTETRKEKEVNLIKQYLPPMNYAHTGGNSKRCLSIKKKTSTAISLDKDVYEKVKAIGQEEDRSFSQQVNKLLKDYLANK